MRLILRREARSLPKVSFTAGLAFFKPVRPRKCLKVLDLGKWKRMFRSLASPSAQVGQVASLYVLDFKDFSSLSRDF